MRIYNVTVDRDGEPDRVLKVPSKTDAQAIDAAAPLLRPGEAVGAIEETDDPYQDVDAPPAGTQTHPDRIV